MNYEEYSKLCFAFNHLAKKCRCLKETYCGNGYGEIKENIQLGIECHKCKFYKPKSDKVNNDEMRKYLSSLNPKTSEGKK